MGERLLSGRRCPVGERREADDPMDALFAAIEARRNDTEFMERLRRNVAEHKDLMDRLPAPPSPPSTQHQGSGRDQGMPAVTALLDTYTEGHGPSTRDALLADPRCRRELLDALTERVPYPAREGDAG